MTTEEIGQDEPKTALLLTEQEWADLAAICGTYLKGQWKGSPAGPRERALAERLIVASKP